MSPQKKPSLPRIGAARRRAVDSSAGAMVEMKTFTPDQPLPLVIEPRSDDLDLAGWIRSGTGLVESKLLEHGALLFRDFDIGDAAAFEEVAAAVAPPLVNYVEGSSPRVMLGEKVYTSTEYPPEYFVSMHNELSYAHRWPSKLLFFCSIEPQDGGQTPIADSREVLKRLSPATRKRFVEKGVRYVRNLHGDVQGTGLSWQTVFETDDRAAVEAYCDEGGIETAWKDDGGLWTRQDRPAVARHPKTEEEVWFNQVDQWHPSNLGEELAEALTRTTREEDLPINALHGDGTPLAIDDLEEVRQAYRDVMVVFPWRKGDVLVVDNMLVAHGRMPFSGPRRVMVAMGDTLGLEDAVAS